MQQSPCQLVLSYHIPLTPPMGLKSITIISSRKPIVEFWPKETMQSMNPMYINSEFLLVNGAFRLTIYNKLYYCYFKYCWVD